MINSISEKDIQSFIKGYIAAMLWSSGDGEENESFEGFELSDEAQIKCAKDCRTFIELSATLLLEYVDNIIPANCTPWAMAGHDFWLTRAGHGVGYWDRGLGEIGEQLSELCGFGTQFPNLDPYLGDDGLIYI